jgi:hypothetical protein
MKVIKKTQKPGTGNMEQEEREYWEARGPLSKGARGKLSQPVPNENRSSFLSVRLSGKEITQLRNLSQKSGLGPSTFARQVLVSLVEKAETRQNNQDKSEIKNINIDESCDQMMKVAPQSFRAQIASLLAPTAESELNNKTTITLDKSQFREIMEMNMKIMTLLAEVVNPELKVVPPSEINYSSKKVVRYHVNEVSPE